MFKNPFKLLINRQLIFLALFLAFLATGLLLSTFLYVKPNHEKIGDTFRIEFEKKKNLTQHLLKEFGPEISNPAILKFSIQQKLKLKTKNEDISIFCYSKDSLSFWSDNTIPFPIRYPDNLINKQIVFLANGWYGICHQESASERYFGLFKIKNEYSFENDYLSNTFASGFTTPPGTGISLKPGNPNIVSGNTFLCSLSVNDTISFSLPVTLLFLFIWLSAFSFFWLFVFEYLKTAKSFRNRHWISYLIIAAGVILSRVALFTFDTPWTLYSTEFFSPLYYASSSMIPSFGDLFVNVFLFFFLSALFFVHTRSSHIKKFKGKTVNFLVVLSLLLFLPLLFESSVSICKGLVLNSNIPLNLNNIFSLNLLTLLTYAVTAMLFLGVFLVSRRMIRISMDICGNRNACISGILLTILVYAFYTLETNGDYFPVGILLLLLLVLLFSETRTPGIAGFMSILLYLSLFSALTSFILVKYQDISEKNQRRLLAQKLLTDRDPLAEYAATDIFASMKKDKLLPGLLLKALYDENEEAKAISYILEHSLKKAWVKYNLGVTICGDEKMLNVVIPNNTIINCDKYFSQLLNSIGQPTISKQLHYLAYGNETANYLAIFPFQVHTNNSTKTITVYIDITSKTVPKGLGYPELLVDKKLSVGPDAGIYSYAFYKNNALTRNVGKYTYSLQLQNQSSQTTPYVYYNKSGYNHLEYSDANDTRLLISIKNPGLSQVISPFAYLFVFYAFMLGILLPFLVPPHRLFFPEVNFRTRLQYAMTSIILASFIAVGMISWFYISRQNDQKNNDALSEKAHSILIEVQQKLASNRNIGPEMGNDLYVILNKLSFVFFTDINFYNTAGDLIASSRPQVFEQGLLSTKINPDAYQELRRENLTSLIHKEKIGTYEFLSAYLPCRNQQDQLIGYLNLPYFARQAEIRNDFSNFLVAFITIYVILIVISILATIFIAKYLTAQLSLIKEKLTGLKFGKPNEKIELKGRDEIANLVEAYNMMIDKLALSAEQLARSERESAWREMAKQVAHEIKNPLTPMKLSVQHLKRAWDENASDFDKRVERFTNTIVEQIDSLSTIASEFSDFAKMPEAKAEPLDLREVILNAVELYRDNTQFDVITSVPDATVYVINADKKQLLRALINLIKNAIQSFVPERRGVLTIRLEEKESMIQLSVKDNGHGISREQQPRIFSPNFTTRSSGMGLGLAMVKTIIEENGGSISFTSQEGIGTIFTISLPAKGN